MTIDPIARHVAIQHRHDRETHTATARQIHVVDRGDTLPSIARQYQVDPRSLEAANPGIVNPLVLYPGDRIVLPAPVSAIARSAEASSARPMMELEPTSLHSARDFADSARIANAQATRNAIHALFRNADPQVVPASRTDAARSGPLQQAALHPVANTSAQASNTNFKNLQAKIPQLGKYVPQGMTAWNDGKRDLLLITAYSNKNPKQVVLFAVNSETGKLVGKLRLPPPKGAGHGVDSIAVNDGFAFIHGGDGTVNRFKLSDLKQAIRKSEQHGGKGVSAGEPEGVIGNGKVVGSQMAIQGNTLYSTSNAKTGEPVAIHMYNIDRDSGELTPAGKIENVKAPLHTQGFSVTKKYFIFSIGNGVKPGKVHIVDRKSGETVAKHKVGSLPEGIAVINGKLYVLHESGSKKYQGSNMQHPVEHIQFASLRGLKKNAT